MFPGPICEPHFRYGALFSKPVSAGSNGNTFTRSLFLSKPGVFFLLIYYRCYCTSSLFYGKQEIPSTVGVPPDFVANEASLFMTTPGTVHGVAKWREITRISLCHA
jgi:hypothetical protein